MNNHRRFARAVFALLGLLASIAVVSSRARDDPAPYAQAAPISAGTFGDPPVGQPVDDPISDGAASYVHTASWSPAGYLKELIQPIDIALADDGRLYVADGRSGQVLVFRADNSRPISSWTPGPGLVADAAIVIPGAISIDPPRAQVAVLWQTREATFVEIRSLDGAPVAGPWRTPAGEAIDLAIDPDTGDALLPARLTCRVYRLLPADGTKIDDISIRDLGCEANHIAALPGKRMVIQVDTGVHLVDATGYRVGGYGLQGHRALDVAVDDQADVHVLVRTPPTRVPASDALVLVFGQDRRLKETLGAAELALPPLPWDSLWPWALDIATDRLAVTTAADNFLAAVRISGGGEGWTLTGDATQRSFSLNRPSGETGLSSAGVLSLAMAPDGRLVMLDEALPKIIAFAPDGTAEAWAPRIADVREIAVAPDGTSYATTTHDRLLRFNGQGTVAWSKSCTCGYGGGKIAVSEDRVFVGYPRQQAVAMHDAATGQEIGRIQHRSPVQLGWWPADLSVAGGRLFTADMAASRLEAWSLAGQWQMDWPAGVFDGPFQIAAGRAVDGEPIVAALMTDGYVELYSAASGRLIDRWLPQLSGGGPFDVADLAMDDTGRIFFADATARVVRVFEPRDAAESTAPPPTLASPTPAPRGTPPAAPTPPKPTATATVLPTPSDAACRVTGDKVVGPARIRLGETAVLTLTLRADCPPQARTAGADIVLLMDQSSSMTGRAFDAAREAAVIFTLNTDPGANRIGVVAFSDHAWPVQELTGDLGKVVEQLEQLNVVTRDGPTDVKPALEIADQWLGFA